MTRLFSGQLDKSLNNIGQICALNKNDPKYGKIVDSYRDLAKASKDYNDILKECCIEPGQRMENLHNKIEEVIMIQ